MSTNEAFLAWDLAEQIDVRGASPESIMEYLCSRGYLKDCGYEYHDDPVMICTRDIVLTHVSTTYYGTIDGTTTSGKPHRVFTAPEGALYTARFIKRVI